MSLKDFVTNASHELKTPLMSMNTEIDYAMKTKGYEQGFANVKQQLKGMNQLLETLVTISKLEAVEMLKKDDTDLSAITESVVNDVQKIYQDKHIAFMNDIQAQVIKKAHKNSRSIIVKNIIENACKFTPEGGNIEVVLNKKALTIKDTGK